MKVYKYSDACDCGNGLVADIDEEKKTISNFFCSWCREIAEVLPVMYDGSHYGFHGSLKDFKQLFESSMTTFTVGTPAACCCTLDDLMIAGCKCGAIEK